MSFRSRRAWKKAHGTLEGTLKDGGHTILITGGGSGIGLALARRFVAGGNTVVACGRDAGRLEEAKQAIPGLEIIRADVTDEADRENIVVRISRDFPGLNILVNNAGQVNVADLSQRASIGVLERETAVNFVGPVALAIALLPVLRANPSPMVANVTTGDVFVPGMPTAPHCATRTALHVMTRALRHQWRDLGVRVVEIMPPPTETAGSGRSLGKTVAPDRVAERIWRGLLSDEDEIVVGASRIGRLLGRMAPRFGFLMPTKEEMKPRVG